MEDDRAKIDDYMVRYGYGPKEAEAVYRLKQARNLISEIYQADVDAQAAADAEARAEALAKIEAAIEAGGAIDNAIKESSETGPRGYSKIYSEIFQLSNVNPHFDALENLILRRALDRTYPEGWGNPAE